MSPGARPRARWVAWFLAGLGVGAILGSGVFAATADPGTEALPAGSDAPAVARFGEETIESGIRHDYGGGFNYFVGGGVAVFDCDDDRKADVYLAGGEGAAALYRNASEVAGELQFVSVDSDGTDLEGVVGAYPVDVDSDSVVGDCRFERANEAWGIDGGNDWTAGFSATWEEGSTLPTLAFGNYLEIEADDQNARDCVPSALHRPAGQLTYGPPVPLAPGLCTLSVLFSDWNAQGRHDLRMANDRHYYAEGGEQLWRLDPGREPALYTASEGWEELSIWGMGLASGDVTGDHLPEVVITSQGDNKLQTLAGDPSQPEYTDIAIRAGASAHRPFMGEAVFPSTAWHPELADQGQRGCSG